MKTIITFIITIGCVMNAAAAEGHVADSPARRSLARKVSRQGTAVVGEFPAPVVGQATLDNCHATGGPSGGLPDRN